MAARQACCVGPQHQQGAAGREPEPGPPCTGPRGGECRWGRWGRSSPQLPDGEDLWPHAGPGAPWSVPRGPGTGQLPPLGTGGWATAGTLPPRHRAVCSWELASWGQQPCLATSIKRLALRPQKQASAQLWPIRKGSCRKQLQAFVHGSPLKRTPGSSRTRLLGPGQAPKLSPGPQAFPLPIMALDSYRQPTHPVSSQHWQLRAGAGGTKGFRHSHSTTPDAHPLTRTAWEGPPLTPENGLPIQPGLIPGATRYQPNSGVCLPATHPSGDHKAASLKAEDQRELPHGWHLRALKCPCSHDLILRLTTSDPGPVLRSQLLIRAVKAFLGWP